MKVIELEFDGYYREEKKDSIKSISGVYCVYSCIYNKTEKTVSIQELLYIGESENIHDRLANHERLDDWLQSLNSVQTLCYTFAEAPSEDKEHAEAALIFKIQPKFNTEHTKDFVYESIEVKTSGKNKFLPLDFIVTKGDKK